MNHVKLVSTAIVCFVVGCGAAAYTMINNPDQCPQPSAVSVTTLFAPCQAFAASMGPNVAANETMDDGSSPPVPRPASTPLEQTPTPEQLIAKDFRTLAHEHATVGVAK
jgi:hypothetical protein